MYVCMYVCMFSLLWVSMSNLLTDCIYAGQIAQVVEHQTADPWIAGSSLTSGEKCKNC